MNNDSKINVKQFDPASGYPIHVKILTLGPQGCGKSCMVKRLCENKFVNRYIQTIGVDYGVKKNEY